MSGVVVEELTIERSGLVIVRDVSLSVPAGQVTALLGPNGAGKTTLLEGISGLLPVEAGRITVDGTDVTARSPLARSRAGLAHVEQGRTVFGELTVEENLLAAGGRDAVELGCAMFPRLQERLASRAVLLSGGEQQMLVIARAVARRPSVLLLDELSLGLAPVIVRQLMTTVRRLADDGAAVLLVEQFANLALRVADTASVLQRGSIVMSGPATQFLEDPELLHQAYLAG